MALKEFQAWGPPGGPADTYTTADGISELLKNGVLEPGHAHLFSIQARSYLDAMQQYYRAQNWGEYKPMLDESGNPYPDDIYDFED
jgi:hypothetical protein